MKNFISNILKGWITTLISLVIYIITSVMIWRGTFDFLWEGIGGYAIGTILLLAPDNIVALVNKWMDNKKQDPNGQ